MAVAEKAPIQKSAEQREKYVNGSLIPPMTDSAIAHKVHADAADEVRESAKRTMAGFEKLADAQDLMRANGYEIKMVDLPTPIATAWDDYNKHRSAPPSEKEATRRVEESAKAAQP